MERIIDLHIHTTCSDGKLSPVEVLERAKQHRVSVLSISDHDTTGAYSEEFFSKAQELGIKIIPAVEISTDYKGVGIHILGYNFNLNNRELQQALSSTKNSRADYYKRVSQKLEELGFIVDKTQLENVPIITKAHIAEAVVTNKVNENILMQKYGYVPKKGEFIETVMNEGCPAFVEKFKISSVDASKLIRNAGGKVVLAHPVAYKYEDNFGADRVKELIQAMNADGLEANYIYIDRFGNEHNEIDFWKAFARENNLFVTCGSDFHLVDEKAPDIGFANKSFKLTGEEIDAILKNLDNK